MKTFFSPMAVEPNTRVRRTYVVTVYARTCSLPTGVLLWFPTGLKYLTPPPTFGRCDDRCLDGHANIKTFLGAPVDTFGFVPGGFVGRTRSPGPATTANPTVVATVVVVHHPPPCLTQPVHTPRSAGQRPTASAKGQRCENRCEKGKTSEVTETRPAVALRRPLNQT